MSITKPPRKSRIAQIVVALLSVIACEPATLRQASTAPVLAQTSRAVESSPSGTVGEPPARAHELPTAAQQALQFSRDDLADALMRAEQRQVLVFVDAWAEWCHTCLSMESVVLNDPSLAGFASSFEFVALDTEKPDNAAFVERFAMSTWPTFFVLRPGNAELIGHWPGAASVGEMRAFLEQSLDAAAAVDGGTAPKYLQDFLAARRAQSLGHSKAAADAYSRAYAAAPASWARRSELLVGYLGVLLQARRFSECAQLGKLHLDDIHGAARPGQFAQQYFTCLGQLRTPDRAREVERAVAKMRALAESPSADMSFDDQVDAFNTLATALSILGREQEASRVLAARLAAAEQGANSARSPVEAQAFDRVRALAYVRGGRYAAAVALLEQRQRELPHSYAAPALLAEVHRLGGDQQRAVEALKRAASKAEGPRRASYLERQVQWLEELGDKRAALAALEELIAVQRSLPGASHRQKLERAKKRRAALLAELGN